LAKQAVVFTKVMHVGKLLACSHETASLAMLVAHADNVLRDLSATANGLEAASSSVGKPSRAMAFFTRAIGRKCLRDSPFAVWGAPSRLHAFIIALEFLVFSRAVFARFMRNVLFLFAVSWTS
jgi:hypothetical protein